MVPAPEFCFLCVFLQYACFSWALWRPLKLLPQDRFQIYICPSTIPLNTKTHSSSYLLSIRNLHQMPQRYYGLSHSNIISSVPSLGVSHITNVCLSFAQIQSHFLWLHYIQSVCSWIVTKLPCLQSHPSPNFPPCHHTRTFQCKFWCFFHG